MSCDLGYGIAFLNIYYSSAKKRQRCLASKWTALLLATDFYFPRCLEECPTSSYERGSQISEKVSLSGGFICRQKIIYIYIYPDTEHFTLIIYYL
jgi:hypothetical protein